MAKVRVWQEPVHPMDSCSGSVHIEAQDVVPGEMRTHTFTYTPVWFGCGETGYDFACSCGFRTSSRMGHGCWQEGHDKPEHPVLDTIHAVFLMGALKELRKMDPDLFLWDQLEDLAFEVLYAVPHSFGVDFVLGMGGECSVAALTVYLKDSGQNAYAYCVEESARLMNLEDPEKVQEGLNAYFRVWSILTGLTVREVKRQLFTGPLPSELLKS